MEDRNLRCSRRKFLAQAAALTMVGGLSQKAGAKNNESPATFRARPPKPSREGRKPIAVVCTVYRPMSHAYHIAGRFVQGYARDGAFHVPKHYVRTLYVDQVPDNDLSRLRDEVPFREQMELDSMDFLDIVMELRKRYRVQIPEEDYSFLNTMASTVSYLLPRLQTATA